MTNITTPVGTIRGEWDMYESFITYNTDIPGMERVKSTNLSSSILSLGKLEPGTYNLTGE